MKLKEKILSMGVDEFFEELKNANIELAKPEFKNELRAKYNDPEHAENRKNQIERIFESMKKLDDEDTDIKIVCENTINGYEIYGIYNENQINLKSLTNEELFNSEIDEDIVDDDFYTALVFSYCKVTQISDQGAEMFEKIMSLNPVHIAQLFMSLDMIIELFKGSASEERIADFTDFLEKSYRTSDPEEEDIEKMDKYETVHVVNLANTNTLTLNCENDEEELKFEGASPDWDVTLLQVDFPYPIGKRNKELFIRTKDLYEKTADSYAHETIKQLYPEGGSRVSHFAINDNKIFIGKSENYEENKEKIVAAFEKNADKELGYYIDRENKMIGIFTGRGESIVYMTEYVDEDDNLIALRLTFY